MSAATTKIEPKSTEIWLEIACLDTRYEGFRLPEPKTTGALRRSIGEQGQLQPIVVNLAPDGTATVIDGFKRLAALRDLGRDRVRVRALRVEPAEAEAAIALLNAPHRGLAAIEEAWIVRSLCREHGLTQLRVGELLDRSAPWVSRRLLLCEQLVSTLQDEIRLGLLSATVARELARLPRGKQLEAARCIRENGLGSRKAARLVGLLLRCEAAEAQDAILQRPELFLSATSEPSEQAGDPRLSSAGEALRKMLLHLDDALQRCSSTLRRQAPSGLESKDEGVLAPLLDRAQAQLEQALGEVTDFLTRYGLADVPPQ